MLDNTAHPYAVGMCVGSGPGQCSYLCSGALIAPNLVLTARHCVAQTPASVDCSTAMFGGAKAPTSDFWFTTYPSLFQGSVGWHQAASVTTPAATSVCGNDIALVILKSNVPSNEATPVTPLVWDSMTNHKKYSTSHTAIGFGNDGTTGAGTRRIKQNMIIGCIPGDKVKPCPMSVNQDEFISDDGVCAGDSGSSAYEQLSFNANTPITFGVASRAGLNNGNCQGSIYERTDNHTNLIVQVALQAAQMGGYAAPPWTVQPPPPPMDAGIDAAPDAGATGTKMVGDMCSDSSECASPLSCVMGICTQACDANNPCPDPLTCQTTTGGDFCLPPKPAPVEAGPPPQMAAPTMNGGCDASGGAPSLASFAPLAFALFVRRRKRR